MTWRSCLLAGALGVLVVAVPGAAVADDPAPGFSVSSDGVTWSTDVAVPLFDAAVRWVPGDERTSTFYVRDDSPYDASVRILAQDASTRRLTATGAVVLSARASGGAWQRLTVGAESGPINAVKVGSGQTSRIDIRAVFDPTTTNLTQGEDATLSFVVRLSDARVDLGDTIGDDPGPGTGTGTGTGSPGDDGGQGGGTGGSGGSLPGTGAPDLRLPVALAALLIGAGVALVRRRPEVRHG